VDVLRGDAAKAREQLGWTPKIPLAEMVQEMVAEDLSTARTELTAQRS
jgi:GDPmannose 4,6-dehydratase